MRKLINIDDGSTLAEFSVIDGDRNVPATPIMGSTTERQSIAPIPSGRKLA